MNLLAMLGVILCAFNREVNYLTIQMFLQSQADVFGWRLGKWVLGSGCQLHGKLSHTSPASHGGL